MNRFLPLVFAIIAFVVFGVIILKHERHIAQGDDIYIKLTPVDPRSLIQGDYMQIAYDFHWALPKSDESITSTASADEVITSDDTLWQQQEDYFDAHRHHYKGKSRITIWVVLDDRKRVIKSTFDKSELSTTEQSSARPLVIKNPRDYHRLFYAAASSFMFAEGLADCYANAQYAHQRTDTQGNPILIGLVDDELQSLACEKKAKQRLS